MKRTILILTVFILAASPFLFTACDLGEPEAKELGPFDRIQSNGSITFKLITGPDNKVISTTVDEAMYNVTSGQLNVNGNGNMTIAIKDIEMLSCNACMVENSEPLVADTLVMYVHAGAVDLKDIQINGYLELQAVNTGSYEFSGFAHFFDVSSLNLATVEAFDLVTDSTYVRSTAAVKTEVNATKVINVFILSSGNVHYKGNPPVVRLTKTGSGELIEE